MLDDDDIVLPLGGADDRDGRDGATPACRDDAIDDGSLSRRFASTRSTTSTRTDRHVIDNDNDDNNTHVRGVYSRLRYRRRRRHNVISVRANCAIQGLVAMIALFAWQLIYTLPRVRPLVLVPMMETNTPPSLAFLILFGIAFSNLFHSITFFVTLKHMAGGATSAGVLKGLQAVLVFCASSAFLCGRWDVGGGEMCWSACKLVSLFVVLCGIALYTRGMYGAETRRKKTMDDGGILCV